MPASSAPLGGYGRHIYEDRDARDARGENQQPWSGQSTVPTKPSIYHQGPPSGLTPESQSSGFPWTRKTFERSASSATVPGILVEPPVGFSNAIFWLKIHIFFTSLTLQPTRQRER